MFGLKASRDVAKDRAPAILLSLSVLHDYCGLVDVFQKHLVK